MEPRVRVIKTSLLLNRIQQKKQKTNTICEPLSFMVFIPQPITIHPPQHSGKVHCTVWWAKPDNSHANSYIQKLWRGDACKHMCIQTMYAYSHTQRRNWFKYRIRTRIILSIYNTVSYWRLYNADIFQITMCCNAAIKLTSLLTVQFSA